MIGDVAHLYFPGLAKNMDRQRKQRAMSQSDYEELVLN